jgi:hypothetical protein
MGFLRAWGLSGTGFGLILASFLASGCHSSTPASATTSTSSTASAGVPTVSAVSPSSGLNDGGITVTVIGTNFTNVSSLLFGGNNASSYTVTSASAITATVPPSGAAANSTSSIDVTVTNDLGKSTTSSSDLFTYTFNTLTRLAVIDTSVHGGTSTLGTVSVAYRAPSSGYTLQLTSSAAPTNATGANVPSSVTIAPGFTTGSFVITTSPVQSQQCYLIQASLNGTQSGSFCVIP